MFRVLDGVSLCSRVYHDLEMGLLGPTEQACQLFMKPELAELPTRLFKNQVVGPPSPSASASAPVQSSLTSAWQKLVYST